MRNLTIMAASIMAMMLMFGVAPVLADKDIIGGSDEIIRIDSQVPMPLYPLIRGCSSTAKKCIILMDEWGPYGTHQDCMDRLSTILEQFLSVYSDWLGPDGTVKKACGTLRQLRGVVPNAYPDEGVDT